MSSQTGTSFHKQGREAMNPGDSGKFSFVPPVIENELNSERILKPMQAMVEIYKPNDN